jgi:hypothetical protein
MLMRGGTSKGAYFLASDLPRDTAGRDAVLLALMGSPDPRQIDGLGGAHPLTSKVAVVSRSTLPGCDIDFLFCQVGVDQDRPHLFFPRARVKICQGAVAASVAVHRRVIDQGFCTSPAPIAVGHQGGLGDAEFFEMAGQGWIHRGVGIQGHPTPLPPSIGSRGVKAGDLQPTPFQQSGVGRIGRIPHDLLAHETVKVAAVAIATGIHLEL